MIDQLPRPRSLRPEYQAALRHELETLVVTPAPRRRRWRPGVVIGLSVGIAVAGGAAAAAYVEYQPVTNHATAHCYSLPNLDDNNGTTVAAAGTPGSPAQVTDALQTCSVLWQDGFLVAGVDHVVNVTGTTALHAVPNLVVCTMADGTAGVFPGNPGLCARLGFSATSPVSPSGGAQGEK